MVRVALRARDPVARNFQKKNIDLISIKIYRKLYKIILILRFYIKYLIFIKDF
jgi:hypothetical protein